MKQSPIERGKAVLRLAQEPTAAIGQFTGLAGVSEQTLIRWATQGKGGIFLDALLDRQTGRWLTSAQAVARFLVAVGEREKGKGG